MQIGLFDGSKKFVNDRPLKVLVACEESQTVTIEFRKLGHEAYSCDIQDCSGGHPEWHIKEDAIKIAYNNNYKWDLMIAHPPCTYLSNAGARWLYKGGELNQERYKKGLEAKEFFIKLLNAPINKICVENPKPSKIYNLPNNYQVVQPYEFGHPYSKRTQLWLKNLPELKHTNILSEYVSYLPSNVTGYKKGQKSQKGIVHTAKAASKTFQGIAKAMAEQWGGEVK